MPSPRYLFLVLLILGIRSRRHHRHPLFWARNRKPIVVPALHPGRAFLRPHLRAFEPIPRVHNGRRGEVFAITSALGKLDLLVRGYAAQSLHRPLGEVQYRILPPFWQRFSSGPAGALGLCVFPAHHVMPHPTSSLVDVRKSSTSTHIRTALPESRPQTACRNAVAYGEEGVRLRHAVGQHPVCAVGLGSRGSRDPQTLLCCQWALEHAVEAGFEFALVRRRVWGVEGRVYTLWEV